MQQLGNDVLDEPLGRAAVVTTGTGADDVVATATGAGPALLVAALPPPVPAFWPLTVLLVACSFLTWSGAAGWSLRTLPTSVSPLLNEPVGGWT